MLLIPQPLKAYILTIFVRQCFQNLPCPLSDIITNGTSTRIAFYHETASRHETWLNCPIVYRWKNHRYVVVNHKEI